MTVEQQNTEKRDIAAKGMPAVDEATPIPLDRRYTLYPNKPIPMFHAPPAMAYKVVDGDQPDEKLHGLVCDPKLHPRLGALESMNMLAKLKPNVITPVAWSVVFWEEEGRECPVLVMKSGRLEPFKLRRTDMTFTDDTIVNLFLRPSIEMLVNFEKQGLTHRAIHLKNMFYFNELKRRIVFGECLSTPPGLTQGALFDTLDAGLSVPLGKGSEFISDDIYALGMVTMCMMHKHDLSQKMTDQEIVARKMMYGSYDAFHSPKLRLSNTIESLLRAMLDDNRQARATTSDLMTWLNGQNLRIEIEAGPKRSSKPMVIGHQNFFSARELAKGMADNWEISTKRIASKDFGDWIRNNLSETHVSLNYDAAIAGFDQINPENRHRLLARIITALHVHGAIRYRSFSATIDGTLRLISHFVHNSEAREVFRQLMGSGIIRFWDMLRRRENTNINDNIVQRYESYIEELRKDSPIEGLNVLVYQFNLDLPCQSKRFERFFVFQPRHILPAIETILESDDEFDSLIDFHIICFLKARYHRSVSKEIRTYMITSVPEEACVAEAEILAKLQNEYYPNREFVHICRKLCELLEPAIKRHHSRSIRREARAEIRREAERGHIRRLVQIVTDKDLIDNDKVNFNLARAEYATILQDINFVDFNLRNISIIAAKVGGDISGWIAGVLASLIALGYVFYWSLFA